MAGGAEEGAGARCVLLAPCQVRPDPLRCRLHFPEQRLHGVDDAFSLLTETVRIGIIHRHAVRPLQQAQAPFLLTAELHGHRCDVSL